MDAPRDIAAALVRLRNRIAHAPGHDYLYGEFDEVLQSLATYRRDGGTMTEDLAREILATVDILFGENNVGRRPWIGNWETYFRKCMEDAKTLLKEAACFVAFPSFCSLGYCNKFLDAFRLMDGLDRNYEEDYPRWSTHFAHLASLAAEMFSLVADSAASVDTGFLEHPSDRVFTWLLSGFAKSESPQAGELLNGYLEDDEAWVRRLAEGLLHERTTAQQARADGG